MTAILVSSINRYIGTAADVKPIIDVKHGSTFLETDTGDLYGYSIDGGWTLKTDAAITTRVNLEKVMSELLDEVKKTNEYLEVLADKV